MKIGDTVARCSKGAGGRNGQVIELDGYRARIHWTKKAKGEAMNVKSWERIDGLMVLTSPESSVDLPGDQDLTLTVIELSFQDRAEVTYRAVFKRMPIMIMLYNVDIFRGDELLESYSGTTKAGISKALELIHRTLSNLTKP